MMCKDFTIHKIAVYQSKTAMKYRKSKMMFSANFFCKVNLHNGFLEILKLLAVGHDWIKTFFNSRLNSKSFYSISLLRTHLGPFLIWAPDSFGLWLIWARLISNPQQIFRIFENSISQARKGFGPLSVGPMRYSHISVFEIAWSDFLGGI